MAYFAILLLLVVVKELIAFRPALQVVLLRIYTEYTSVQILLSLAGGAKTKHTR